jgi:membrane-associated phospholipid phosphatase
MTRALEDSSDSRPSAPVKADKAFLKSFLEDGRAIWSSPLKIKRRDARWLIPFGAVTAMLIAAEARVAGTIGTSRRQLDASRVVSAAGSGYVTVGAARVAYALGWAAQSDKTQEVALLGLAAVAHASIVTFAAKQATNRERPDHGDGRGRFWAGGNSFPSGYAATNWALATVVAEEAHSRWIGIAAYGWAGAVSISRLTGRHHFPSDLVVGAALGHLIGCYMIRAHSTPGGAPVAVTISPWAGENGARGLLVAARFWSSVQAGLAPAEPPEHTSDSRGEPALAGSRRIGNGLPLVGHHPPPPVTARTDTRTPWKEEGRPC